MNRERGEPAIADTSKPILEAPVYPDYPQNAKPYDPDEDPDLVTSEDDELDPDEKKPYDPDEDPDLVTSEDDELDEQDPDVTELDQDELSDDDEDVA